MAKNENISMSVIRRMPRYYRFLTLLIENDIVRISSKELSARMGITASQIRQDLNCFGGFGQQGYGYIVADLQKEIGNILGLNNLKKTIVIGAGNIGRVVSTHMILENQGFKLIGIFDKSESLINTSIRGIKIQDSTNLESFCKKNSPLVAAVCIPTESVPEIADRLIALGIKAFWNFSHFDILVKYPDIAVENVHLNDSLMTLSYKSNEL